MAKQVCSLLVFGPATAKYGLLIWQNQRQERSSEIEFYAIKAQNFYHKLYEFEH